MRSALALACVASLAACGHQPSNLRDTTGTIWDWSCGASACDGTPRLDAGVPGCSWAWGTTTDHERTFLLCGGPVDDAGTWNIDPTTCRAAICLRDTDCPDPGGGRILQCTGGLCEDHDVFPTPSPPLQAAALCLADVPRSAPCADPAADPRIAAALAPLDGGCAAPCDVPPTCLQP